MKLTPEERAAGIGLKRLIIARFYPTGEIARVMSPQACTYWNHDGATWTLDAPIEPAPDNTAGVYVTYKTTEARRYAGTLCKVILSGTVIEHETGARGQRARLLEVCE
jgi:hypothetical protein